MLFSAFNFCTFFKQPFRTLVTKGSVITCALGAFRFTAARTAGRCIQPVHTWRRPLFLYMLECNVGQVRLSSATRPLHRPVTVRVATHGKQVAPLRGLESTASRIYFLCCASLLFEALECCLLSQCHASETPHASLYNPVRTIYTMYVYI